MNLTLQTLKVITFEEPHTFIEAVEKLKKGHCLGIRPQDNSTYLVPVHQEGSTSVKSGNFLLRWVHSRSADVRSDQYLGEWFLVLVDHRELRALLGDSNA